jgi:hypothetical protein
LLHATGGGFGSLVVPFPPCGPPLLGCLLAWTSSVLLAPCFLFLSLSWVLSFSKVYQGFIKGCCFLHLLNPAHDPPNLQVWFYITDWLWTILYIYIIIPLASVGLFVNPRSEEEEEEEEALKSRE